MTFNKIILPSGVRLITIPMPDNPSIAVLVMVEAGSKYETKKISGISHFLEHTVFKGTPSRPKSSDISRELDGIGANYNAFTGHEVTGYWVKAAAKHLDKALDVVSDMYLNPLLAEKEIEKEKGVIVEEIRMYQDLPQRHVHDVLSKLMHGDQPAGWNVAGTEETVRNFTRQDLLDYRNQHYVGKATTLIIAGNFDEKELIKKAEKAFSGISFNPNKAKLPVIETQNAPALMIEHKETDQTHLVIAVRTFSIHDPRVPAMQVLCTLLSGGMSSRLFTKMRDQLGICYYIRASYNPFTDHGDLAISAGVDNGRVELALKEILAECSRLKTEVIPEAELKKTKDYIAGTTMLELETSEARAEFAGSDEILKGEIESPEEHIRKVNAVTAADVQTLACEIFVNKGLNMALIGRSKEIDLKPLLQFKD